MKRRSDSKASTTILITPLRTCQASAPSFQAFQAVQGRALPVFGMPQ